MQRKEADFDVRRYFQSILSPDTIKMYSFLLTSYRENSPKVNHYIHSFFYRAKHFKIYQHEDWTMQPLLFNIHVLLLFNRMLQDTSIQRQADMKSFLDFIRGVVRDFFALAEKNHLLFVEALLRQPYATKSALLLQRNYEPHNSMAKSRSEAVALGREKQIALINEVRRQKKAIDAEELEGEEEFQFTLGPSDFQATSLVAAKKRKNQKQKTESTGAEDANEDDENENEEEDDDEEAEFGGDLQKAPSKDNADADVNGEAAKTKARKTRAVSERAKNWTKVEDRYLEKMFSKYHHLPSVYEVISYEDMFQDRDRTAEQIERRVKYLKLHRKTHDSSDKDEDGRGGDAAKKKSDEERNDSDLDLEMELGIKPTEEQQESSRPRRRLRRVTTLSDDSESEDDLLQTGNKSKPGSPLDQVMGSHSPSFDHEVAPDDAAAEGTSDMQNMETPEDEVKLNAAVGAQRTLHSNEGIPDDEANTQMIEDEIEVADFEATQAIDEDGEATQAINDEENEDTQMIDDEADTQAVQPTAADENGEEGERSAAVESAEDVDVSALSTATDPDSHTQILQDAMQARAPIQDEAASALTVSSPVSSKRARDPTDDGETSGDAEMNGSPQKKVVRTAGLDGEVSSTSEN